MTAIGTVIADTEAELAFLERSDFNHIIENDVELGLKLLRAISHNLSSRLRATNNAVLELDA